jgi:4-amino-4-deoxy-L-arabinose transferase-like glycosyltransferase
MLSTVQSISDEPSPQSVSDYRRWLYPVGLAALCAVLYFWRLGLTPLDDFDEAYYAEGAREMLGRGDLGTPFYNGRPFLLKPILIYWLIAGAFRLFGTTEFAARSVSAFFATAAVLATYWFGVRTMNRRAGLFAGLALALNYLWIDTAREAMIDMPLVAALAPSMFLLFLATEARPEGKRQLYLAAFPLLGIAILAKGPLPASVVLLGLAGYLLSRRRLATTLREAPILSGAVLLLVVAAPWYNLAVGFYPWIAFVPAALVYAFRQHTKARALRFAAWWTLIVLATFSFAGAKLPHYLVPVYPALALLVAGWFDVWIDRRADGRGLSAAACALLAIVGLVFTGAAIISALMPPFVRDPISSRYGDWTPGTSPVVILGALAAGSLAASIAAALGWRRFVPATLAASMCVVGLAHVGWFKPRLAEIQAQPRKELAQFISVAIPESEPLGVYYAKRNATIFYARRPIVDLGEWEIDPLIEFLSSPSPAVALTHEKFLPEIEAAVPRASVWTRRGDYVLVANHPLDRPAAFARPGPGP